MIKIDKTWVNPKYITSIEPFRCIGANGNPIDKNKSKVWVVGNAGYGTYSILSPLTPDELASAVNRNYIDCDDEEDMFNDGK